MINIYFYTSSRGRREFVRAKVTRKNAALISLKTNVFPSFLVITNPINIIEAIELFYINNEYTLNTELKNHGVIGSEFHPNLIMTRFD